MRINVLAELRLPVGTVASVDFMEERLKKADLDIESLRGSARMLRTDRGLLVGVHATGLALEACSRCLKQVRCEVLVEFEEEYVPIYDPMTGGKIRSGFESDAFRIADDFVLDLREGIRQYLLIAEPTKPLCCPDCAGLCSNCGTDLNAGPCSCAGTSESRWNARASIDIK